jgi:hypothetical protein
MTAGTELIATHIDLPPAPRIPDGDYVLALLDAMVARGWQPELIYNPAHGEWLALLRGPDGAFHRNEHPNIARALIGCVVRALGGE